MDMFDVVSCRFSGRVLIRSSKRERERGGYVVMEGGGFLWSGASPGAQVSIRTHWHTTRRRRWEAAVNNNYDIHSNDSLHPSLSFILFLSSWCHLKIKAISMSNWIEKKREKQQTGWIRHFWLHPSIIGERVERATRTSASIQTVGSWRTKIVTLIRKENEEITTEEMESVPPQKRKLFLKKEGKKKSQWKSEFLNN